jgi:hypothetical protein
LFAEDDCDCPVLGAFVDSDRPISTGGVEERVAETLGDFSSVDLLANGNSGAYL